jgi:hypothetical protein
MKDYKELEVWKKGILLVLAIYEAIKKFPKDEHYALADQIKRGAVSINFVVSTYINQKDFRLA